MNIFEDRYDELHGLIKAGNKDCFVYLCKVVPRGDVDVTGINESIENSKLYCKTRLGLFACMKKLIPGQHHHSNSIAGL